MPSNTPEQLIEIQLKQHKSQIVSKFLDALFEYVEDCFDERELTDLNRYLELFTPHVDTFMVSWSISVLRASGRAKLELPAWVPLRNRVEVQCDAQAFDKKRWMRGLLDK